MKYTIVTLLLMTSVTTVAVAQDGSGQGPPRRRSSSCHSRYLCHDCSVDRAAVEVFPAQVGISFNAEIAAKTGVGRGLRALRSSPPRAAMPLAIAASSCSV